MSKKTVGRIFLIGFMGSGKTHWGKLWSAANQLPFIDLDDVIETTEGKKIVEIFETKGEGYFREKESILLRSFSQHSNVIIACGGGTPCFHQNMQWMNENGTTVYISATPAEILQRVIAEQDQRPLLKGLDNAELLLFIEKKLKEREPFYYKAQIVLNANEINEQTFQQKIIDIQL